MIRLNTIKESLKNLVGWEQPYDWDDTVAWGMEGESGVMVNDVHPLLTIENVRAVMPENFTAQYPLYDETLSCEKGSKVRYNDDVWLSTADAPSGEIPSATSDYWVQYDCIKDYLSKQTEKGIQQMITRYLQDKSVSQESKQLLEERTLFDGSGRLNAILANRHKIVGMEINPVRSMGVTTKIERIGLQMRGGSGVVRIYVFHSSQNEPIYTYDCNYTSEKGMFQWFYPTDMYLPYMGETTADGGSWYIVYNQDDLPEGTQAINVSKDWSREPCGTCNIGSLETWREITKYLQISPFMVKAPTTFAEFPEMWDVEDISYTNTQNYGLNFEISVGCDLTSFIIRQRGIFADVLAKQIGYNVLRTLAMNPDVRVNRNQSNVTRMDILYELDGNTQGRKGGLGYEMEKAYKALELDTSGIDRVCNICNNHGVKYRTV